MARVRLFHQMKPSNGAESKTEPCASMDRLWRFMPFSFVSFVCFVVDLNSGTLK